MKIQEINAKSLITKSGLPGSDFVINPYVGCTHGCIYCYARFMKKFTNHPEPWGEFLDVKINAADLIPRQTNKYRGKSITISSVTDPYQPLEKKYKLMREIFKNLIPLQPNLCILTKSDLVTRDIDLIKQFKNIEVGVSLSLLDDKIRKEIEPLASSVEQRINAVKELKKVGLNTFVFISPMFPVLSDWQKIIKKAQSFTDEFWFENLNIRATNWPYVKKWLKVKHPNLIKKFEDIYFKGDKYWDNLKKEIRMFCQENKISHSIYFHHQKSYS